MGTIDRDEIDKKYMAMLVAKQKEVADEVLNKLEVMDYHTFLAGGAPRNWIEGKLAKDLDFYFEDTKTFVHQRLNKLFGEELRLHPKSYEGSHLKGVYEFYYKGIKCQLMNVKCLYTVVDTFGVSISKVIYKNGKIKPHTQAAYSFANKKIIYDLKVTTERYVSKVRDYYPGYEFIKQRPGPFKHKISAEERHKMSEWCREFYSLTEAPF